MATELDLVNRALVEIASRQPITSLSDNAQGVYASTVYAGAVDTLLRQEDFEFARKEVALTPSGGSLLLNWTNAYLYPSDCVRVRQVVPATWDPNDPLPVRWTVGDDIISANPTTVIWTNIASASLIYSSNDITPDQMDPVFTEMLVRYLGSIIVMGIAGRPDFSKTLLSQAGGLGVAGMDKDS